MIALTTLYENSTLIVDTNYQVKTFNGAEENLVQLIKAKNERGFNILYDKYCGALYGILTKIVKRSEIADDLLQDTFVKIWKNIDKYDASKGTLFTWMLNIARNLAIDYLRSTCYRHELQNINIDFISTQKDYNDSISVDYNEFEFNDFKTNALKHLNPKCAEVIDMIFFFGCTHEQAAQLLKLPLGTIKTRARVGLTLLRGLYKTG